MIDFDYFSGSAIGQVLLFFVLMVSTFMHIYFSGILEKCWDGKFAFVSFQIPQHNNIDILK